MGDRGWAVRVLSRGGMIAACALILSPAAATSGVIRGTVRLPAIASTPTPAPRAYPGQATSLPSPSLQVKGLVTDAVLYLDRVPTGADSTTEASGSAPKLGQQGQAFAPRVLAVRAGTTVDFPNRDPIYHNVFSLSPPKRFDLGKYPKGQSRSVTFNKPGLVNVFCDIHSDMAAFVLVLPHRYFTRPGAGGTYELPSVPAGRYVVRLWHPDFGEHSRHVELTGSRNAVLDFALAGPQPSAELP